MKRREFIKLNVCAGLLAATPLSSLAGKLGNPSDKLFKLIVDDRHQQCKQFLNHIDTRGINIEHVSGDLSSLWMDSLWSQIESEQTWIAGVTTPNTALTLEMITRDYGHSFVQTEKLLNIDKAVLNESINRPPKQRRSEIIDTLLNEKNDEAVFWVIGPSTINFKGKPWV
jgi:hypothetical protein